jgi:hypothetical protein
MAGMLRKKIPSFLKESHNRMDDLSCAESEGKMERSVQF